MLTDALLPPGANTNPQANLPFGQVDLLASIKDALPNLGIYNAAVPPETVIRPSLEFCPEAALALTNQGATEFPTLLVTGDPATIPPDATMVLRHSFRGSDNRLIVELGDYDQKAPGQPIILTDPQPNPVPGLTTLQEVPFANDPRVVVRYGKLEVGSSPQLTTEAVALVVNNSDQSIGRASSPWVEIGFDQVVLPKGWQGLFDGQRLIGIQPGLPVLLEPNQTILQQGTTTLKETAVQAQPNILSRGLSLQAQEALTSAFNHPGTPLWHKMATILNQPSATVSIDFRDSEAQATAAAFGLDRIVIIGQQLQKIPACLDGVDEGLGVLYLPIEGAPPIYLPRPETARDGDAFLPFGEMWSHHLNQGLILEATTLGPGRRLVIIDTGQTNSQTGEHILAATTVAIEDNALPTLNAVLTQPKPLVLDQKPTLATPMMPVPEALSTQVVKPVFPQKLVSEARPIISEPVNQQAVLAQKLAAHNNAVYGEAFRTLRQTTEQALKASSTNMADFMRGATSQLTETRKGMGPYGCLVEAIYSLANGRSTLTINFAQVDRLKLHNWLVDNQPIADTLNRCFELTDFQIAPDIDGHPKFIITLASDGSWNVTVQGENVQWFNDKFLALRHREPQILAAAVVSLIENLSSRTAQIQSQNEPAAHIPTTSLSTVKPRPPQNTAMSPGGQHKNAGKETRLDDKLRRLLNRQDHGQTRGKKKGRHGHYHH